MGESNDFNGFIDIFDFALYMRLFRCEAWQGYFSNGCSSWINTRGSSINMILL